jgi:hypothetical protein
LVFGKHLGWYFVIENLKIGNFLREVNISLALSRQARDRLSKKELD